MTYRIELDRVGIPRGIYAYNEHVELKREVVALIQNIEDGFYITKIIKQYKDGSGVDVTDKFLV